MWVILRVSTRGSTDNTPPGVIRRRDESRHYIVAA
jgi:hypothetical protein